mmetsp:Transcript_30975/g.84756  ORF Transcript_30975/g.84756 Transcript_30975/m.84756 type:complete len:290 (+) Transcript_30975:34-903(+)
MLPDESDRPLALSFSPTERLMHDSPREAVARAGGWSAMLAVGTLAGCCLGFAAANALHAPNSVSGVITLEAAHAPTSHETTEGEAEEAEEAEEGASAFVQVVVVCCVVLVITGLLYAFEKLVHHAKHRLPSKLIPVLNSMLSEFAGLGFIGVLLKVVLQFIGKYLESLSEEIFGEDETLVEVFEWLHTKFFEAATLYFIFNGVLLVTLISHTEKLIAAIQRADADNDGEVTVSEFKDAFGEDSFKERKISEILLSGNLGLSIACDGHCYSGHCYSNSQSPPRTTDCKWR